MIDEVLKEYINVYLGLLKEFFGSNLISAYIFGSVARGEATESSDIDVIVVVRGLPEDIGERLEISSRLKRVFRHRSAELRRILRARGLPTTVSDVLLTPEEVERHPPILLDLTVNCIPLIDKDGFLSRELERVRERLRELGAVRVKGKHGWYWILKPGAKLGDVIKI